MLKKVINFFSYIKYCYYRGYYICHRDEFKTIIFELEGIDIDNALNLFKEE